VGRNKERRLDGKIGSQKRGLTHTNEKADAGRLIAGRLGPIESLQCGGGLRTQFQPKETRDASRVRQGVRRRYLANGLDEVWT
jgi:hypothetical protein